MAIKYYTNPEKKMVIAVLKGTELDCINKIEKVMGHTDWEFWASERYMMPNCFRAVAKCAPEDVYNEEAGKALAKERVMRKYHKHFDLRWNKFKKQFAEINEKIQNTY